MFQRILLLSDLTETTLFAVRPLAALARKSACSVVLYHAASGSSTQFYLEAPIRARMDAAARRKAEARLEELRAPFEAAGLTVEVAVEIGSAFDLVPGAVERYDADLVVIPTRSHHSTVRRVSGSTTARTIRSHAAPVLTMNERFAARAGTWADFDRVVHPVDFGPDQRSGLHTAEDFAVAYGKELELLHVEQPVELDAFFADDAGGVTLAEVRLALAHRVDKLLAERKAAVRRVPTTTINVQAQSVGQAIVDHAALTGAGLVVLPTVGHSRVHTQLMGSVAEYVIKHAHCPVLAFDGRLDEVRQARESAAMAAAPVA